jgi:hypothetical protein
MMDMRRGSQRSMKNVGTNADVAGLKARSTKPQQPGVAN